MPCICCSQWLTFSPTYMETEKTDTMLIVVARKRNPTDLSRGNLKFARWLFERVEVAPFFKLYLVHNGQDPIYCFSDCFGCVFFFFLDLFDLTLFVNKVL